MIIVGILFIGHLAFAQRSIDEVTVTVGLDNEPLENCFKSIERQTGFLFALRPDQTDPYNSISLPKASRTISATLDLVLAGTNLTYRQLRNSIVIFEKSMGTDQPKHLPDLPPLIKGKVTSQDGYEIPDVSIIIRGTTSGTKTSNGSYSIYAPGDAVLVFSHIAYRTIEVPVKNRLLINVVLEPDEAELSAVEINAGYWQVKEIEQTGNISRITSKDIEKLSASSPLEFLHARMPGVYVQQNSGVAGGNIALQIRGRNSLRHEGNFPLYLIDGIPFPASSVSSYYISNDIIPEGNPLCHINPADIESIEILKDADATAIYGSRGANGVVLITMKKAKNGKNKIGLHLSQGIGQVTRTMRLLNTQQWLVMRKEAFSNDGATMTINNARDLLVWDTTHYTDWQKELIGNHTSITDVRASFTGGDDNKRFYFGTSYYRETPPFPGNFGFQKGSWYFSFNAEPLNRFMFNFSAGYVITSNELPREDPSRSARQLLPNAPLPYNQNGELNFESGWTNPMSQLMQLYDGTVNNSMANGSFNYHITPGLELKSSLGYIALQTTEWQKIPKRSFAPTTNEPNRSLHGTNDFSTLIAEPLITYTHKREDQELTFLAGLTFQQTITKEKTIAGSGYKSDELLEDLMSATELQMIEDNHAQYRYSSLYTRLNYSYKKKLFLNFTARRDGSSRLSPDQRFGNFGAIGTGWIFTKEKFFGNGVNWLSFGKLRSSYGITGNDLVRDYQYLDTYSATSNTYNGLTGTIPTRLRNADYSFETNRKGEVAMELGLFNNRLLLSSCYYYNRSSDQVTTLYLPLITGHSTIQANIPAVIKNTGLEFTLSGIIAASQDLTWNTSLNVSVPRNELTAYPNINTSPDANQYLVGESLSIQNKYRNVGLNSEGIYAFADKNQDGQISSPLDYYFNKKIGQTVFGGYHNALQFRNLKLDILVQFVRQTSYNYLALFSTFAPGSRFSNQPDFVMNRWQRTGDASDVQRFTTQFLGDPSVAYRNLANSDHAIGDASFIRVKDITLSWNPASRRKTIPMVPGITVYLQSHNIFTITKYKGYDPESVASGALPPLRTITCGIKMTI